MMSYRGASVHGQILVDSGARIGSVVVAVVVVVVV